MKKYMMLVCMVLLLGACGKGDVEKKEGSATLTNNSGETTMVDVELKGDKIEDVDIDETAKGSTSTKKELNDKYNMKQASPIKKEWYQQVEFFEDYVEQHGVDKITLNSEGKAENADVLSGCTISVDGFIKGIQEAKANAIKED